MFEERETQVLGLSVDSKSSLKAFATGMGGVSYPLLADFYPHGAVLQSLDLFNQERGTGLRSALIIDKKGTVRWAKLYEGGALPTPNELIEELDRVVGA